MPSQAPSKVTPAAGLTKLAARGSMLKRAGRRAGSLRRWAFGIVAVAVVLVVLWELLLVGVGITTSAMWFESVRAGSVYETIIVTKIVLFAIFGVIAAVIGGGTLLALRRMRPRLELSSDHDTFRWTFRRYESRFSVLLMLLAIFVPGILAGRAAASGWQTALLWLHAVPVHQTDPLFHKDISFYLEVYPFHQLVVNLLLQAVGYGLWIAGIGGYWYGLWRLRRGRRKITRGMTTLTCVLVALFLLLKAAAYWISRYGLTTSTRGPVTGAGYTDTTAGLPSRYVLVAIALLAAIALVANVVTGSRVRVLAATVVVTLAAVALVGTAWPAAFYRLEEAPSAAKVDLHEIAHNQQATKTAFGLQGTVSTVRYDPSAKLSTAALVSLAERTAQISLIDPNQLSPTWNVLQAPQSYYGFKSTLDVSHYPIDGTQQDVALAVRELRLSGIPGNSWVNSHLVYTHGYGIVAAPTTEVDPRTESPVFLDSGFPPEQQIPVTVPQIYFGQFFGPSAYSIVGEPKGSSQHLEFDHPGSSGSSRSAFTTYDAHGGIPLGSSWRQLLFALQLRSPNVFFSNELNSSSQLLEVRNPRARVAKVAPWLTLDGNVYPAVVNGRIDWVVDGYTTSSTYPNSQLVNLHTATNTTLVTNGASVAQPNTKINYMRNSVKAVVDAYSGKVTLYSWNQKEQPDPILQTWEKVFPGLVKPQSDIPSALLSQLRYPTDLFTMQRYLLAKYHVTGASDFYNGNDFWSVPGDPTFSGTTASTAGSTGASAAQPAHYMSLSPTGDGNQRYSLSSPMVTLNGRELASYLSVDAQPGSDYGKITVLKFPADGAGESPTQVQNDIESDTTITEALSLQRTGNSRVVLGDLEAIPLAGRILYVEPVYTRSSSSSSFPVLRHVIALYGNGNPSFDDSLGAALQDAISSGIGAKSG